MTLSKHSRRNFLATAGAFVAATSVNSSLAASAFQQEDASTLIAGKDKRLLILKKYPAVFETPLKLLAESAITPKSLLFVRNNQQPEDSATCEPSPHSKWDLKFVGGINRELSVSLSQLREMAMTEYEMVLQCSGNGRSLFSKASETSGTQWGRGGVGNVRFAGVKLSTVLEKNGIEIDRSVRYVDASGADTPEPGKEDFLHSLPIDQVLNTSILALDLNGEPLAAIHGGPLRLVTPGVYGTMHIKWLDQLNFVTEESMNENHIPRYRVPSTPIKPGAEYDFTLKNSTYNWNMNIKSVLLNPNDGDQLRSGSTVIKGIAFNDGATRITAVLLSVDNGNTWQHAELTSSDSLYGWTQFQLKKNLPAGRHPIWCRAIDSFGRTQPSEGSITWNPRGYEWNGIEKITVDVT